MTLKISRQSNVGVEVTNPSAYLSNSFMPTSYSCAKSRVKARMAVKNLFLICH